MGFKFSKILHRDGVSSFGDFPQRVGVGRIIVPESTDRDLYVKTCYRCGRVDVFDENSGQYIKQCAISQESLQRVKFPRASGEIGSPVVWVSQEGVGGYPIVIGVLPESSIVNLQDDESLMVHKEWDGGYLDISGSAKEGFLTISVSGVPSGSVFLNVLGDENSLLKVRTSGSIEAIADKKVSVQSFGELSCEVTDVEENTKTSFLVNNGGLTAEVAFDTDSDDGSKCSVVVTKDKVDLSFLDSSVHIEDKDINLTQDQAYFEIKEGKLALKNSSTSLKEILDSFSKMIQGLVVVTPAGSSTGLDPVSESALQKINVLLGNLFNE